MENPKRDAEYASTEEALADLQARIDEFSERKKAVEEDLRRLMLEEDPASGRVYAAELHELRQGRMVLETEILALRQRMRRIRLAVDDGLIFTAPDGEPGDKPSQ